MADHNEKIPDPKEIEKEISEFLAKKFKNNVKIVSPVVLSQELALDKSEKGPEKKKKINFELLPEDLIAYLDQFIVKQDLSKAILATKICTHFNRIRREQTDTGEVGTMVGSIKNNVLMLGPTGVGKTYTIKLIASKIGVPFVKGDATKFSETGYVGGDVEDLVRDLVREADDDIELAQYGIIYIDEIDKIAGSRNLVGADVSRTGVQRGLLKPMEETEVDLKVPHDPISMIQEIERFRKTGKRSRQTINTKNILFIMSGAFTDLPEIIRKRVNEQAIGFSAPVKNQLSDAEILQQVRSEDLIKYGFESEFVGRLPVRAVFEDLTEPDLFEILRNPNNPIILGKKLDFAAYGIEIAFDEKSLQLLATKAYEEGTGARGLVSAVEGALLPFEKKLPSISIRRFPVTADVIQRPKAALEELIGAPQSDRLHRSFERIRQQEYDCIKAYLTANRVKLAEKYSLTMTPSRIQIIAMYCSKQIMEVGEAIRQMKSYYDDIKKIELYFFKNHDINVVMEDDAIDYIIGRVVSSEIHLDDFYKQLNADFEHGLKLVREKTGRSRFFITREALLHPETYIHQMLSEQKETP